ncbi:MFS transporter [Streptomyces sp. NPDC041068]|uniref:MFS transporter n=1 Tax=Streptomyces sp. NPDC041068 TaxID=3155130 RepID=UPI0033C7D7D7
MSSNSAETTAGAGTTADTSVATSVEAAADTGAAVEAAVEAAADTGDTGTDRQPPPAGTREWIGLAVLAFPALLLSMDLTVLYMALPTLGADLGANSTQSLWIADIYPFMLAGFLVTMGTLGDRIGRRRLLMLGAAAFSTASVLAAFASSAELLIAARALLGVAGATVLPSTMSLITTMFKRPAQRASAIGLWMMAFSVGAVIGPVVGGVMLERFWWGSVFLLGVPVMALLLVCAPALLPEHRNPSPGRLDPLSVALSLAAILPVIHGLKELARDGFAPFPLALVAAGLVVGRAFVVRQRRLADPLLDLRLFAERAFSGALVVFLLGMITLHALTLFFTQYLQLVEGLSPVPAGLWMIPFVAGTFAGLGLAPRIARRVRPAYVIAGGLLLASVGFLVISRVDASSGPALLAAGSMVVTLGFGPLMVLGTNMIVGSAPPERAGAAASVSETGAELGAALGVAVLGSVGTAVYRAELADADALEAVPHRTVEAARESLAAVRGAADGLPEGPAGALVDTARDAFATGVGTVALISAVLLVGLAGLALALLRHVRPIGAPEE